MQQTAITGSLVVAAAACVLWIAARTEAPQDATAQDGAAVSLRVGDVLASERALYLEDAPGARGVAVVDAVVAAQDDARAQLSVTLSAMGAGVVAFPGLAGVAGSNLRTAEEMERLCSGSNLRCALRRLQGTRSLDWEPGTIEVARRGHIPERRILADGTIEWDATHPALLPIELRCDFPMGHEGRFEAIVFVEEIPRLAVVFRHDGRGAVIESLTSLGEHLTPVAEGAIAERSIAEVPMTHRQSR